MNTITDSIYGTGSLFASSYRGLTPANSVALDSAVTHSADKLQKMLATLEKIDTALESFRPAGSKRTNSSNRELAAPATSTRLESSEEINPTISGDLSANTVNPGASFDGSTGNTPNFESGFTVIAGSFKINGVVITVAADSTIYSVLSAINSSAADVTASYSSTQEKVVLTHNTLGPGSVIDVADDSSGFLDATKLADATPIQGAKATNPNDNSGVKARSYRTADMLGELDDSITALLEASDVTINRYQGSELQSSLSTVIENLYADFGKARLKKAGLEFTDTGGHFLSLNDYSRRRLVHRLQGGDRYLLSALTGDGNGNGKTGLIPALQESILAHIVSSASSYSSKGTLASYRA